jgi:hypothetical protein
MEMDSSARKSSCEGAGNDFATATDEKGSIFYIAFLTLIASFGRNESTSYRK